MNTQTLMTVLIVVSIGVVGGYGLYEKGMSDGMKMATPSAVKKNSTASAANTGGARKPLYWHDPMVPQQKFDHPGKSPFMDMQLVPVYADDDAPGTSTKTAMEASGASKSTSRAPALDGQDDRKPLYWHDPMYPQTKFDHPGKSPFMDMQLVPVYAAAKTNEGGVRISSRIQQNLGLRTAKATKGMLGSAVTAVGSVAYNERDVTVVQARSNGFLERLYARAPFDPVSQGEVLAALYAPDWVAVQEEYLSAKRIAATSSVTGLDVLIDGARQRMRLAGMDDTQIALVERTGTVHARLTITAPRSGVITELGAREGMTVMAGTALFRINGLATVWVNAALRETDARYLNPGTTVEARAAAFPGEVFRGKVGALLPEVDQTTRTLKVRIELANPRERLKPGMFVTVNFAPPIASEVVLVPTEAVIETGTRAVVMVANADGSFAPFQVVVGGEANGQTEIREGLSAGQDVVVSGQFLIDSEASLRGTVARMGTADGMSDNAAPSPTASPTAEPAMRDGMSDGMSNNGSHTSKEMSR